MDKLTAATAVYMLRKPGVVKRHGAIASLIESQEAEAAAMRAALESIKKEAQARDGTLWKVFYMAASTIESTTAGADLLAVVRAAERLDDAATGPIPHYLKARFDALHAALAARRGGEKR